MHLSISQGHACASKLEATLMYCAAQCTHLLLLVVSFTLTPQTHVHVLEDLLDIACEAMHSRVPVAAGVAFQGIEHDWQDDLAVLRH